MPKNYCIMQIWAESGKSALPICNYSQILYQFLTFTQNLKRSQDGLQKVTNPSALSFVEIPVKTALDTAPVPTVPAAMTPVAVIRSGRLTLELSNDISESLLCRLLQEVLHA